MVHLVRRSPLETVESAEIAFHRLCGGNHRRLVRERIANVQIHRMRIAAVLPYGRHINATELKLIAVELKRKLVRIVIVVEIPLPVQASDQWRSVALLIKGNPLKGRSGRIRNEIASARKPVHIYGVEIAVVSALKSVLHACHHNALIRFVPPLVI